MSLSLHQASVGTFQTTLNAFVTILNKAGEHAAAAKFDPAIYATMRLRPNMLPFNRQVHIFCDHAKNGTARIAGVEAPRFEDTEATLDELKARIEKTLAFIATVDKAAVDGGASRDINFGIGPTMKAHMKGADYLMHYCLPNYYFHLTTAYDILRFAGVEIGKRDFLGQIPGITIS